MSIKEQIQLIQGSIQTASHSAKSLLQQERGYRYPQDGYRRVRPMLQRRAVNNEEISEAPPIVHEVLHSPGQPLDKATRALFESRFCHDFGQVSTHTGAKAEESARAVNASAYTIGSDIVFGKEASLDMAAGQHKLLAHELIHVAQQDLRSFQPKTIASEQAEREAVEGSNLSWTAQVPCINTAVGKGSLQRQKKEGVKGGMAIERGFEIKPDEEEKSKTLNKFNFTADVTVPLVPGLQLGPVFFLDKLKLESKGSAESEQSLSLEETEISSLQAKLALGLARLEMEKLKLPTNLGTLSLGAKLGATGSLKKSFGEESKFIPKVEGKAGLEFSYQSPDYKSPYLTLGGLLGEKAYFSAGVETGFGIEYGTDKGLGSKLSAGGFLSLSGKQEKGPETFIKLKFTGDVDLDLRQGIIDSKSESFFVGLSAGATY